MTERPQIYRMTKILSCTSSAVATLAYITVECGLHFYEYFMGNITLQLLAKKCSVSTLSTSIGAGLIIGATTAGAAIGTTLLGPGVGTFIGIFIGYIIGVCAKLVVGKGIDAVANLVVNDAV